MALYTILSRVFPRSFVAKLMAITLAGFGIPLIGILGLTQTSGAVFDQNSLMTALFLGALVSGYAFRAVLSPFWQLEQSLAALEAGGSAPPMQQACGDLPGQLVFRVNRLMKDSELRVDAARRMAERDPLTGLLNRRGLERALMGVPSGSILALDLDWFKRVNDQYGHAEGDRLLVILSQLLTEVLRRGDLAARMGGEEFVVVLPGLGTEAALQVAERVRMAVEDRLRTHGEPVTVSIGVASRPAQGPANWSDLMRKADNAVYCAKARGRNRVEIAVTSADETVLSLPRAYQPATAIACTAAE